MKLFALGCLASGALAKDIKQHKLKEKMMENRLKFDRDVIMNPGNGDDDEEWDPWDLEDEELQVRTRPPRTESVRQTSSNRPAVNLCRQRHVMHRHFFASSDCP